MGRTAYGECVHLIENARLLAAKYPPPNKIVPALALCKVKLVHFLAHLEDQDRLISFDLHWKTDGLCKHCYAICEREVKVKCSVYGCSAVGYAKPYSAIYWCAGCREAVGVS